MVTSEEDLRSIARHRARAKLGFYIHLSVYIVVNVVLFFVWLFTGGLHGEFPWFIVVVVGWGIGVIAQGLSVFMHTGYLDRKTEQEYKKTQGRTRQARLLRE